jgi:transposase-like protein
LKELRKCPVCGQTERQVKRGFTPSGSQRILCRSCGKIYTPDKKRYSEETKRPAIKLYLSGVSGRGVGKILGISPPMAVRWIKKTGQCVDKSSDKK